MVQDANGRLDAEPDVEPVGESSTRKRGRKSNLTLGDSGTFFWEEFPLFDSLEL
jgi:hypothetical protein